MPSIVENFYFSDMMRRIWTIGAFALLFVAFVSSRPGNTEKTDNWDNSTGVAEVLASLGENVGERPSAPDQELVSKGEEIIKLGKTLLPDGKRSKTQSRYFVCTDCHNVEKEDPDLRISDPEARLDYVVKKNIPFLQGTTLYGTINKTSWYNDDYFKKYGDLVKPARDSIEGAIQLCAEVCSQGRKLSPWEMKAVLAYFWSLELKLGDLSLSANDWDRLKKAKASGKADKATAEWLKGFYRQGSPATFVEAPEDHTKGYDEVKAGNAKRGEKVYEYSCMTCHAYDGPSKYLKLDDTQIARNLLKNNIKKYNRFSIYEIVRHGTHPFAGHKPYMPHFPEERMSHQQVEDLRAYLEN